MWQDAKRHRTLANVCNAVMPITFTVTATAGSEPDWVLDLVATGFNKPENLFGHSMRSKDDLDAAADAFKDCYTRVRLAASDAWSFWRTVHPVQQLDALYGCGTPCHAR